ncbi:acetate--CoA ligase [Lentzea terrae]|uniref:acetate--CoA ligase n=1 Tax=Lentzea terrae TaxID=2200761 RepID=UPI000DD31857|nr:acetate--CoA ligase [Lentzea terrae]
MGWEPIRKRPAGTVTPNLLDYERTCSDFSWESARRQLTGLPGGGLNMAYEAVDRHAAGPLRDKVALRCRDRAGHTTELTYDELRRATNRFANVLRSLGVGKGDRVATLLGRVPELYVTAIGAVKNTSVYAPLFSGFGPEPVRERLRLGDVRVLVTTPQLYRKRVEQLRDSLPALEHVLVIGDALPGTRSFAEVMAEASDEFTIPPTSPDDMALLHFTSGTTGKPKGAVHVHGAVLAHHVTAAYALDLHTDDVYWCTADPGWVTGTSYGIIAPLTHGVTMIVDASDFDAHGWYEVLQDERVTVWYTAPTALRMLMRSGAELAKRYELSALRFVASVGEPLNPEVVVWGQEALGLPVHDNWWQTETGAIMISNYAAEDILPGSMGRPMPGVEAGIVMGDGGRVVEVRDPEAVGELALRPGWPSMFRGYLHDDGRYAKSFVDGWYLTGDLARRDPDGYYWFVGRADDVIKSAGHLVGPFEVESALMEHPAVAEAGVIGKPDSVVGEVVKAFVTLREGNDPTEDLRTELIAFGRRRLGAVAPKEIAFDQHLPHTRSGKVMRRLLKTS